MPRCLERPFWLDFCSRLEISRESRGLSRAEFAPLVGADEETIHRFESRILAVPNVDDVERFAAQLGVPVVWLAYGADGYLVTDSIYRVPSNHGKPNPVGQQPLRELHQGAWGRIEEQLFLHAGHQSGLVPEYRSGAPAPHRLVTGSTPPIDLVEIIARGIGCSPGYLAYGIGQIRHVRKTRKPIQHDEYGNPYWNLPYGPLDERDIWPTRL